jgi:hypothetical protein
MSGLSDELRSLAVQTLTEPQAAARRLIVLGPPVQARWLGLALVSVLTLFVMKLTLMTLPDDELSPLGAILRHPIGGVAVQAGSILVMAMAMAFAGRIFGGRGQFEDALLLTVWIELILTMLSAVQFLLLLILPLGGVLLSFVAVGLFIWLMVNFTAALHGFTRLWAVLVGMIATFLVLALTLALIFAFLGITPPGGPF